MSGSVWLNFRFRPTPMYPSITNVKANILLYMDEGGLPMQHPFLQQEVSLASLPEIYQLGMYGQDAQIELPFEFHLPAPLLVKWTTTRPMWFSFFVLMDRASHNGAYNAVRWVPHIPVTGIITHRYAFIDSLNLLLQHWTSWTGSTPQMNTLFTLNTETNMLALHLDISEYLLPTPSQPHLPNPLPPTPTPKSSPSSPSNPSPIYHRPPKTNLPLLVDEADYETFFTIPLVIFIVVLIFLAMVLLVGIWIIGRHLKNTTGGALNTYIKDMQKENTLANNSDDEDSTTVSMLQFIDPPHGINILLDD